MEQSLWKQAEGKSIAIKILNALSVLLMLQYRTQSTKRNFRFSVKSSTVARKVMKLKEILKNRSSRKKNKLKKVEKGKTRANLLLELIKLGKVKQKLRRL